MARRTERDRERLLTFSQLFFLSVYTSPGTDWRQNEDRQSWSCPGLVYSRLLQLLTNHQPSVESDVGHDQPLLGAQSGLGQDVGAAAGNVEVPV